MYVIIDDLYLFQSIYLIHNVAQFFVFSAENFMRHVLLLVYKSNHENVFILNNILRFVLIYLPMPEKKKIYRIYKKGTENKLLIKWSQHCQAG